MDIGEYIGTPLKFFWKHKTLWGFALLSTLIAVLPFVNYFFLMSSIMMEADIVNFLKDFSLNVLLAGGIFLALVYIVFYLLGIVGRIGLIRGAWKLDEGAEKLTFKELWEDSYRYFGRFLLLDIIMIAITVAAYFLFMGLMFGLLALFGSTGAQDFAVFIGIFMPFFFCMMCVFMPLFYFLGILIMQTNVVMAGESVGVGSGLSRAWQAMRTHWKKYLLLIALLIAIGTVSGFVMGMPTSVLMNSAFFMSPVFSGTEASSMTVWMIGLLAAGFCLFYLVFTAAWSGYFYVFNTIFYRRVTAHGKDIPAVIEADIQPEEK